MQRAVVAEAADAASGLIDKLRLGAEKRGQPERAGWVREMAPTYLARPIRSNPGLTHHDP
jgi:hypothetical protein